MAYYENNVKKENISRNIVTEAAINEINSDFDVGIDEFHSSNPFGKTKQVM